MLLIIYCLCLSLFFHSFSPHETRTMPPHCVSVESARRMASLRGETSGMPLTERKLELTMSADAETVNVFGVLCDLF